jgi:hypothetical protein
MNRMKLKSLINSLSLLSAQSASSEFAMPLEMSVTSFIVWKAHWEGQSKSHAHRGKVLKCVRLTTT